MSSKNVYSICIPFVLAIAGLMVVTVAQPGLTPETGEVQLGDVRGAIVTLYYYDPVTEGKGAIVPLPDNQNPQEVEWDANKSAPGTYTFYRVPEGTYYVEAVMGNHSWFAIATVKHGTTTANVAIPPFNYSGQVPTASPAATASPLPTAAAASAAAPSPTPQSTAAPGMTAAYAVAGLALVALYIVLRK